MYFEISGRDRTSPEDFGSVFSYSLDPLELVKLHGFSDASFQNYGAFSYVKSVF